jgi:hypothetical protein
MAMVFISHAHADELLARKISGLLGDAVGLAPGDFFLSSQEGHGVAPAMSIRGAIMHELRTVPSLVVVLTPRSAASPWVWLEAGNRLGCSDVAPPIFTVPSARHMPLLAPVADMRALQLDNDGELHELVQAVAQSLGRTPHDFLTYKPALEDVIQTARLAYSESVERTARLVGWLTRHAAGIVLAMLGAAALLAAVWAGPRAPAEDEDGPVTLVTLNEALAANAARYLVLKGRVTSGDSGVHGATVMVARDGEVADPESCVEPACTRRSTTTDGEFSIDLTRIQARDGDPVFISVVRDGFEFFSRELEVDVRAMDVRTAPQTVVLSARSLP